MQTKIVKTKVSLTKGETTLVEMTRTESKATSKVEMIRAKTKEVAKDMDLAIVATSGRRIEGDENKSLHS